MCKGMTTRNIYATEGDVAEAQMFRNTQAFRVFDNGILKEASITLIFGACRDSAANLQNLQSMQESRRPSSRPAAAMATHQKAAPKMSCSGREVRGRKSSCQTDSRVILSQERQHGGSAIGALRLTACIQLQGAYVNDIEWKPTSHSMGPIDPTGRRSGVWCG